MKRQMTRLIFGLFLAASCAGIFYSGQLLGPRERSAADRLGSPPFGNWSPKVVTIATLGHRGLFEDFSVIWSLQILADINLKTYATAEQVYNAIRPVIQLHPRIEGFYLLSCFVLLDLNEPKYCEEISLEGLRTFPDSWRIPVIQGFIANFHMGSKSKAAFFYGIASQKPNSPDYIRRLAERLAKNEEGSMDDFNETFDSFKEIPGGTKLLEILRPMLKNKIPQDQISAPEDPANKNALPPAEQENLK